MQFCPASNNGFFKILQHLRHSLTLISDKLKYFASMATSQRLLNRFGDNRRRTFAQLETHQREEGGGGW